MASQGDFNPQDLNPEVVKATLRSLSEYSISSSRLKIGEQTLGEGGFGTVKIGELRASSLIPFGGKPSTVAVKILQTDGFRETPLRVAYRLAREMKVWESCKHENVLEFKGFHLSKDLKKAYLISPYMANGNIKEYLIREAPPMEKRLQLVQDTSKGLEYLHTRQPPIVHGDLKSLNILVSEGQKALLSDFGLASAIDCQPTGLSTSKSFKGTIRYSSPESLNGTPKTCSSDIWGWGCLALEILTGNLPYSQAQSENQVLILICGPEDHRRSPEPANVSGLTGGMLALLRRCWSFEADARPSAERCTDKLELIIPSSNVSFPEEIFIPSRRIISPFYQGEITVQNGSDNTKVKVQKVQKFATSPLGVSQSIRKLLGLGHENISKIMGYSLAEGAMYIHWPYGTSRTLESLTRNERLQLTSGKAILRDILLGLQYLHSPSIGIAHGALCPENVLINPQGRAVLCNIVMDFFWDTETFFDRFNPENCWFSPEVVYELPITEKSDIWSWACIALKVMFGRSPRDLNLFNMKSDPRTAAAPVVRGRLYELLTACWIKDPSRRPDANTCLNGLDKVPTTATISDEECWISTPSDIKIATTCFDLSELVQQLSVANLPVHCFRPSSRSVFHLFDKLKDPHFPNGARQAEGRPYGVHHMKGVTDGGLSLKPATAEHIVTALSLKHENVQELLGYSLNRGWTKIYAVYETPDRDLSTLEEILHENSLTRSVRMQLLADILSGLDYLHSPEVNLVHGTLAPANVLVRRRQRAVLCEVGFGVLRMQNSANAILPYIRWCSPEVLQQRIATPKADIWSWGCIALQTMYGSELMKIVGSWPNPYSTDPLGAVGALGQSGDHLPADRFFELLGKCRNIEPSERPSIATCRAQIALYCNQGTIFDEQCWILDKTEGLYVTRYFTPSDLRAHLSSFGLPELYFISSTRLGSTSKFSEIDKWETTSAVETTLKENNQAKRATDVRVRRIHLQTNATDVAREIQQLMTVRHDRIFPSLGYCLSRDWKSIYIISDRKGVSLLEYCRSFVRGRVEIELNLLCDILEGLIHLHTPEIALPHGAICLSTVSVIDQKRAILGDIGLTALSGSSDGGYRALESVASPIWRSPAALNGEKIEAADDIWSWACLAIAVMYGTYPFAGLKGWNREMDAEMIKMVLSFSTPEPKPSPSLPSPLLDILRRCWKADSGLRPTAESCLSTVQEVARNHGTFEWPTKINHRPSWWERRSDDWNI